MKTTIGAVIAIIVLVLIIFLSSRAKPPVPAVSDDTTKTSTSTTSQTPTTPPATTNTTTPATLQVTTTLQGTGAPAVAGDTVYVNYTGMLTDGTVFDSNILPKFGHVEPFPFTLGQNMVIAGWEQGVLGMKVGEKRHLVIPASLGYGAAGAGAAIPPNATLIFDVEVLSIKHK